MWGMLYRVLSGMEGIGIFILTFPDLIGTPVDGEDFIRDYAVSYSNLLSSEAVIPFSPVLFP
jgi:hypothetical protein